MEGDQPPVSVASATAPLQQLGERIDRRAWLIKTAAAVALLVGLLLLLRLVPVERPLAWLTAQAQALGPWGPASFGLLYLVITLFFLPGTPVAVAMGAVYGPVLGTVVISLASTASAAFSFLLGRSLGGRRVAQLAGCYPKLGALYRALGERDSWKIVVAVRLSHALPFGVQNLLFGLTPIRFGPYLLATWASMLPGTVLYVYLGHLGAAALQAAAEGEAPLSTGEWAVRVAGLAVAAIALLYVTQVARRVIAADSTSSPPPP